jgi:hypothetical protein
MLGMQDAITGLAWLLTVFSMVFGVVYGVLKGRCEEEDEF